MDTLSDRELLSFAVENGIIDINTIHKQIEMNERKKYLEMHNHKIWQGKDGYFYTKVEDETLQNKRRLLKKNSRTKLEDAIVSYYKEKKDEPTMEDVFQEWMDQKIRYGEIQRQTRQRYTTDYKRFFENLPINNKKIRYITEMDLEDFIKSSIHDKQLTAKAWGNLRTLLNGIFKYAKRRGYTNISITAFLGDLDISSRAFAKKYKNNDRCVFNHEEMQRLTQYLFDNPTIGNLGVLFAAYTGMRVGEIVALKWEDVTEKHIHVHRTQIRYLDDEGKTIYDIKDDPKTEAGRRYIIIVESLQSVLKKLKSINPFTEYIFVKKGKVITTHVLDMCLYRACDALEIPRRSMHVLRKTYATRLMNSHVDEAVIIDQMGHTDIATTKGYYYYNDKTVDRMAEMISNAINY